MQTLCAQYAIVAVVEAEKMIGQKVLGTFSSGLIIRNFLSVK